MGTLAVPQSGTVYVDTNTIIYTVEEIQPYAGLLQALWIAARNRSITVTSCEIALLETLVKPLREEKKHLERRYRRFLTLTYEVQLVPIDRKVIEKAARLRADCGIKTPDALHAATALESGSELFITNDPAFRRGPGLPVAVLDDLLPT
ncbi:PIN domain-containing protein [Candidatus Gracilibacteria bacterium]|nr:PIN domain-containing protein [Candidatus Gracilibacteria bacterium]